MGPRPHCATTAAISCSVSREDPLTAAGHAGSMSATPALSQLTQSWAVRTGKTFQLAPHAVWMSETAEFGDELSKPERLNK